LIKPISTIFQTSIDFKRNACGLSNSHSSSHQMAEQN